MADVQAHLKQYWHNRALVPALPATHNDWIVTVVFYCGVQLVDAVLAHGGLHPTSHQKRNEMIANVRKLEFIAERYDVLYQLARKVRYLADPAKWVPLADVEQKVLRAYLYPIEHSAYKLLNLQETHTLIKLPSAALTEPPLSTEASS